MTHSREYITGSGMQLVYSNQVVTTLDGTVRLFPNGTHFFKSTHVFPQKRDLPSGNLVSVRLLPCKKEPKVVIYVEKEVSV